MTARRGARCRLAFLLSTLPPAPTARGITLHRSLQQRGCANTGQELKMPEVNTEEMLSGEMGRRN